MSDDAHPSVGAAPPPPQHFDVCGPLPRRGVTVLEASAGTGKTFTIAALVARFVAEGTPISDVLAVTFTRMATGELRDRVRTVLVEAESALAERLDGGGPLASGSVAGLLATGSPEEVAERHARLATALNTFDEATITTTHGFCQLMLAGLGVAGDVATGAELLEDPVDVVEQAVDDLYVRWALRHGEAPAFERPTALEIAQAAVTNPVTPLVPEPAGSPAELRYRLATRVRREVRRRLLDANLLTFDDLLVRLRETLSDPHRGAAAAERLRARYSVVLVDEFQDTDPVQWDVVRTAFGTGQTTLVLIGDPKQAIYAFRGADVYAYLDAASLADRRFTLGENWRSDAGLLAALDAMLDPLRLGHPCISFRPVRAAPSHEHPGLRGAPVEAPLRVRLVSARQAGLPTGANGRDVPKPAARKFVAADLAADVVGLLEADARLVTYDDGRGERGDRRLMPGDVGVLVNTNHQASVVQQALRDAGVPAVVAGSESVLTTPAAKDWLALLEAMEQPANRSRAVGVALTPFLGMPAEAVATAGEPEWEVVHARLHRWSETLRQRGVASLFRTVLAAEGVPGRLLRERDGERRMTDLGHIARLLHAEASQGQQGAPALRAWLARRRAEASARREGADAEERSRWIDSDAEAVQVLTVYRAKGLEFPVVYCPFLWDEYASRSGQPTIFHDPDDGMTRKLDVAADGSSYQAHFGLKRDEERGEALRKLYVALTRARHQVVIWWARTKDGNHSSLGRLLTARDGDGNVETSSRRMPADHEVREHFERIAARAEGLVSVESAGRPGDQGAEWSGRVGTGSVALEVAAFERSLDLRWRRTSYSGITAWVHGSPVVGSEPEEPGTTDEPLAGAPAEALEGDADGAGGEIDAAGEAAARAERSLWADLPRGVDMGTHVHRVLEEIDFAAPDLDGEILRALGASRSRAGRELGPPDALAAALRASISSPLGPLTGGISLRQVERGDRLDEMGFELPVAGGDRPRGGRAVATGDIAHLFDVHEPTGPGAPLLGYGERLRDPLLGTDLRGYLTGSLDLVFRTWEGDAGAGGGGGGSNGGGGGSHGGGGVQRYFVADYKTNWIGAESGGLSAWHYRPAALDVEMQRMHYPLQAIIYMVALHRYLRWRLRGYDPGAHLGGVLYLFLRGMSGPQTPLVDGAPCGVFSWRPAPALVTELSDLLEAGS